MPDHSELPLGVTLSGQEQQDLSSLEGARQASFRRSRLWMRRCLADRFDLDPADVPLAAPPGAPPTLPPGWGWISLSHCPDVVAVVWSSQPVGVDVERLDRRLAAAALARRFFAPGDCQELKSLEGESLRGAVLQQWVAKEAAIKWQRGTLAKDLGQWSCTAEDHTARHAKGRWEVPVCRIRFSPWLVAVAGGDGRIGPVCLA